MIELAERLMHNISRMPVYSTVSIDRVTVIESDSYPREYLPLGPFPLYNIFTDKLPDHQDFLRIMESILKRFIDACTGKYKELLVGTQTERFLGNIEFQALLVKDPLWKAQSNWWQTNSTVEVTD